MNYFIKIFSNKPKEDINAIIEHMDYVNLAPIIKKNTGVIHLLVKVVSLFSILWRMHRNDVLLIQYPMKKFVTPAIYCAHLKGGKVVILIHDLGCFRRKKLTVNHEMRRMNRADYIIAHNKQMQQFMRQHGCITPVKTLGIFDYLSTANPKNYTSPHPLFKVVYAGGLGFWRNAFLYELDSHIDNWQLELYGKQFCPEKAIGWKHIHFVGNLNPDELLSQVEADFGLVWDGDSLNKCSGNWGEYLKINNPHKTSFYLRAGIPIIIWRKAAIAPFVLQHNVGISIDKLDDINNVLSSLSPKDYSVMRQNAEAMAKKLNDGYYTRQALTKATVFLKGKF